MIADFRASQEDLYERLRRSWGRSIGYQEFLKLWNFRKFENWLILDLDDVSKIKKNFQDVLEDSWNSKFFHQFWKLFWRIDKITVFLKGSTNFRIFHTCRKFPYICLRKVSNFGTTQDFFGKISSHSITFKIRNIFWFLEHWQRSSEIISNFSLDRNYERFEAKKDSIRK